METEIKVSFDISSREYNGRWYTEVKAWKGGSGSGGGQQSSNRGGNQGNYNRSNNYSQENSYSGPQEGSQERYVSEDDLPF